MSHVTVILRCLRQSACRDVLETARLAISCVCLCATCARSSEILSRVYVCACVCWGLFGMCCPLVATANSCSKWSWLWPPSGGRQLEAECVVNFFSSFLVISRWLSVEVMSISCKCLNTVKMELIDLFIYFISWVMTKGHGLLYLWIMDYSYVVKVNYIEFLYNVRAPLWDGPTVNER